MSFKDELNDLELEMEEEEMDNEKDLFKSKYIEEGEQYEYYRYN